MRFLFVGGTGLISAACAELAVAGGHEVLILDRGLSNKYPLPSGATLWKEGVRAGTGALSRLLASRHFDSVADFIAFTVEDIERDLDLLGGSTDQFVFISSASAYEKPPSNHQITEHTPLANPFWQYSRDKIACEQRLIRARWEARREEGFPTTIVRPSSTYGPSQIPLCVGSWSHPWTIIDRIKRGKKVIVPGDGSSLWVLTWNTDVARGLLGLLGNRAALGEAYQITSDEVLTWDQIYLEVFRALRLPSNIIHIPSELLAAYWPHATGSLLGDKIHSVVFDNSKIKRIVPDFVCRVKWADGLRCAIQWHESHPEFQTIDHEFDSLMDGVVFKYERAFPGA